jgi:hypothetical protein
VQLLIIRAKWLMMDTNASFRGDGICQKDQIYPLLAQCVAGCAGMPQSISVVQAIAMKKQMALKFLCLSKNISIF